MRPFHLLAAIPLLVALAAPLHAGDDDDDAPAGKPVKSSKELIGVWKCEAEQEGVKVVRFLGFTDDDRCLSVQQVGESRTAVLGKIKISGKKISFQEHSKKDDGTIELGAKHGAPVDYEVTISGDKLTVKVQGAVLVFTKEAGSEDQVREEMKTSAAARKKADDEWKAKTATGEIDASFGAAGGIGGVPRDEHAKKVFEKATVFAKSQNYVWMNISKKHHVKDDPGDGRDTTRILFYPNGRAFVKVISYQGADPKEGERDTPITVKVVQHWGKYKIDGDKVHVEADTGEKIDLVAEDGRRNLVWGGTTLSHTEYVQQLMKKATAEIEGR